MKVKKRKKSTRYRGGRSHGRGGKKKARGSGHRGGFGMSGTGKRGDQKKTLVLNAHGNDYFGKSKRLSKKLTKKLKSINLRDLAQKANGKTEINMKGYKILGEGDLNSKIKIIASAASHSAIEKIKKSGGEIVLEE